MKALLKHIISFASLASIVINNICVSICAKMLKDALNFSPYNSISPDFPIYLMTDYRRKSIIGLLRFLKNLFMPFPLLLPIVRQ